MDSGFHGPKVAGFQVLVSNASFVLCFPNEMTSITGLLLKDNFSFFFNQKSSSVSLKYYKYNLYSIKSDKIYFFALPLKTVNASIP